MNKRKATIGLFAIIALSVINVWGQPLTPATADLFEAVEESNIQKVIDALQRGGDPSAINYDYKIETIERPEEFGGDISVKNEFLNSPTALHIAACHKGKDISQVIDALVATQKVDVDIPDGENGYSPLQWAIMCSNRQAVDSLIQHRANLSVASNVFNLYPKFMAKPLSSEIVQCESVYLADPKFVRACIKEHISGPLKESIELLLEVYKSWISQQDAHKAEIANVEIYKTSLYEDILKLTIKEIEPAILEVSSHGETKYRSTDADGIKSDDTVDLSQLSFEKVSANAKSYIKAIFDQLNSPTGEDEAEL